MSCQTLSDLQACLAAPLPNLAGSLLSQLRQCSAAALKNGHKQHALKQQKFVPLNPGRRSSRCCQGCNPSQGSRRRSFLALPSFWWPLAFLGLWCCPSSLCLCLHMASLPTPHLSVSPMFSFKDTIFALTAHPNPVCSCLTLIISAETFFPNKVICTSFGGLGGIEHVFFGGILLNPLLMC